MNVPVLRGAPKVRVNPNSHLGPQLTPVYSQGQVPITLGFGRYALQHLVIVSSGATRLMVITKLLCKVGDHAPQVSPKR